MVKPTSELADQRSHHLTRQMCAKPYIDTALGANCIPQPRTMLYLWNVTNFSCTTAVFSLSDPWFVQWWSNCDLKTGMNCDESVQSDSLFQCFSPRMENAYLLRRRLVKSGRVGRGEKFSGLRSISSGWRRWVSEVVFLMKRDGGLSLTMFLPLRFGTVRFKEFASIASPRCGRTIAHYSWVKVALDIESNRHNLYSQHL